MPTTAKSERTRAQRTTYRSVTFSACRHPLEGKDPQQAERSRYLRRGHRLVHAWREATAQRDWSIVDVWTDAPAPAPWSSPLSGGNAAPSPFKQRRRAAIPKAIRLAVEESQGLLTAVIPPDEQDLVPPTKQTWQRATGFLTGLAERLYRTRRIVLPVPRILLGPDGGVDLHWKERAFELLVAIPADAANRAGYYGDNRGATQFKGVVDTTAIGQDFLQWLVRLIPPGS